LYLVVSNQSIKMLTLQIKEETTENPFTNKPVVIKRRAVINGVFDEYSSVSGESASDISVKIYRADLINVIESHTFLDIASIAREVRYNEQIQMPNVFIGQDDYLEVSIFTAEIPFEVDEAPLIRFEIEIDAQDWRKPWSLRQFAKELKNQLEVKGQDLKFYQDDRSWPTDVWGVEMRFNRSEKVSDAFGVMGRLFIEACNKTNDVLIKKIDEDSLITFFTFKPETEVACKQYLVYFAQFLADLGIAASTEFHDESNRTLFKVVPKDKTESLQQIKEALDYYLSAPENEVSFDIVKQQYNDISVLQWEANIHHLRGQLTLSQALVATKDAQIEALKITNFHYANQLLLNRTIEKNMDSEDLIEGVVKITEYEGSGFKVNFAEILRRLKRSFKS
jgi:hypothetical protein